MLHVDCMLLQFACKEFPAAVLLPPNAQMVFNCHNIDGFLEQGLTGLSGTWEQPPHQGAEAPLMPLVLCNVLENSCRGLPPAVFQLTGANG